METHGGRIRAESEGPGLGARFTFTIPALGEDVTGTSAGGAVPAVFRSRRARMGQMGVLVVEADPQVLRYVRDALTQAGYAPIVTDAPGDVPGLMEENRPHIVLLDMALPGSDGIELMHRIHDDADGPVSLLSPYGEEQVIADAFAMGAADYVVKPFSPTELVARIGAALRRREAPDRGEPSEPYVLGDLVVDYAERRVTVAGPSGAADPEGVRAGLRAFGQRRACAELRLSAAKGLGPGALRRRAAHAHRHQQPPPQVGRRP